jgi:tetratricopeptide (TPR) repeat protein
MSRLSLRLSTELGGAPAAAALVSAASQGFIGGHTTAALLALDSVIPSPEWQKMAAVDRPYPAVADLYAVLGRPDRARAVLAEYEARSPAAKAPDNRETIATINGEIALAEHKNDEALRQFHAAAVGADGRPAICEPCTYFDLGRAYDAVGQRDSAIAAFEALSAIPPARRFSPSATLIPDWYVRAGVERRLGELYEAKNDPKDALRHYTLFVDAWKNADPDLQPQVAAVRARMAALSRQVH